MITEREYIRRVVITLALVALGAIVWALRSLLLLAFGAVVVAVVLRSFADPIERHSRLPTAISLAGAVAVIVGALAAVLWFFGGEIGAQSRQLIDRLPQAWDAFESAVRGTSLGAQLWEYLPTEPPSGASMLARATGIVTSIGGGLADLIALILGGVYLAAEPDLHRRGLLKLLPDEKRSLVGDALSLTSRALRLWLIGQAISMVVVGSCIGVGLWLLGVPSAVALGLLAGLLEFVPLVGPVIAAVPAILLAFTVGLDTAFYTLLFFLVVEQIEGNALQPLVQRFAIELPPAVFLFALLAFGMLFGLPGVLLAAPVTVVVYILVKRLYVREVLNTPTAIPGERAPEV